jgi:uncharacterized damage-inducible protein DinB
LNPYEKDLGTRDALEALAATPERVKELVGKMREADLDRAHAPNKWTAAQLLDHITETEVAFCIRLRMALTHADYVVQPFDQDKFMAREPRRSGREAFDAYYAVRRWNLPLYLSVTSAERDVTFMHPERGQMTVGDLLDMLAGHELHHLEQMERA